MAGVNPTSRVRGNSPLTLTLLREIAAGLEDAGAGDVLCPHCGRSRLAVDVQIVHGVLRCACADCGCLVAVFQVAEDLPESSPEAT